MGDLKMIEKVNRGIGGGSSIIIIGCEEKCKKACKGGSIDGWAYAIGVAMDP